MENNGTGMHKHVCMWATENCVTVQQIFPLFPQHNTEDKRGMTGRQLGRAQITLVFYNSPSHSPKGATVRQ